MTLAVLIIIVVVVVALMIFVPFVRSAASGLLRFGFFLVVLFLAVAGAAMLMNNETIFDRPGWKQRATKFLGSNFANTSEKGVGDAPCTAERHAVETKAEPAPAEPRHAKGKRKKEAAPSEVASQPTSTPTPTPAEAEETNLYDELMTRNYICQDDEPVAIPREKLVHMVEDTINELKGWKLGSSDPRTGMLNVVHTSRVFGFEDDIKIVVTPHADVEICSQSKAGEPGSSSLLRFFPGDFGANMGHIKEFYATLKPKTDQYCKELEEKQKPKNPNQ
jgi:hypothetical protein